MSGLKSRQRTMIRTRVITSSIISNSFLFPSLRAFRPRGCVYFSASGKRAHIDEGKPETENTLPSGRKIVRLPCPQVWLDASVGELRFAGKDIRQSPGPHKRKNPFRVKMKKDARAESA